MSSDAPIPTKRSPAGLTATGARWCILFAIFATGLVGCGGEEAENLQAYVQSVKDRQKSSIPPLPEPQQYEVFSYDQTLLRNPFEPPKDAKEKNRRANSGLQPNLKRDREILEQYSIGSLRMVGSIEKNGRRWALIIAPDSTLHRTTTGRHMGQDNGKIIKITESLVELKEIVPDGLGGWIERKTTLSVSE